MLKCNEMLLKKKREKIKNLKYLCNVVKQENVQNEIHTTNVALSHCISRKKYDKAVAVTNSKENCTPVGRAQTL